jgi:hypothetical protein
MLRPSQPVHHTVYLKILRTCTKLEPTTTTRKKAINTLETGNSSSCSAAFPTETFPRLLMFLSNLSFRLRILRGRGYQQNRKMGEIEHAVWNDAYVYYCIEEQKGQEA